MKPVVLHHEDGYILAVVPSTHRVEFDSLRDILGRRSCLATEAEIARLFGDCERGAVPPAGAAYGLPMHVDGCDAFRGLAKDARWARLPGSPTSTEPTGRDLYTAAPWG